MSRRAGEVRPAITACCENGHMRPEAMEFAFRHVERYHATADSIFHDEIDREILDAERCRVADRLLIQSMQHRMAGAVGRRAGALRDALAEVRGHAAEG